MQRYGNVTLGTSEELCHKIINDSFRCFSCYDGLSRVSKVYVVHGGPVLCSNTTLHKLNHFHFCTVLIKDIVLFRMYIVFVE